MKKLFITMLLLPTLMFGQMKISDQFNVHTGFPYQVIDAGVKDYFYVGNEILMVKQDKKKIFIQKYDVETGRETFRKVYPVTNKYDDFESIIQLKNRMYYFFSRWNKKETIEQLFYREIDTETGELGKETRLFKVEGKVMGFLAGTYFSAKVLDKFDFYPSYDKTKLVIQYRKKPKKRNDKKSIDEIGMYVFNEALEKQWNRDIKMPYTESKMNNIDYQVDKDGIGYLLAEVYDTDVSKKFIGDKKNYHLEVFSFSENGMEVIDLKDEDHHFNDVWLFESSKGEIYLSGLYSDSQKTDYQVEGFFYIKLESKSFSGAGHYYKIPLEIVNQFKTKKQQKKNKKKKGKDKLAMADLELRQMISTKDGGVLLIAEEHFVVEHTSVDSRGVMHTSYTYHYKDILTAKISSSGELVWMKKLPKAQKGGRGRGGMSFSYREKNGKHYFFYVDNIKNINLSLNEKPIYHSDGSGGIFSVFIVDDKDGSVEKSSLVNLREVKIREAKKPQKVYQYSTERVVKSGNGMVFEVYKKGKEDVMIHIDFD